MSQTGIITHFHAKKCFGFIEVKTGESIYFKRRSLLGKVDESLLVGQEVSFKYGTNHGGKTAVKIEIVQHDIIPPCLSENVKGAEKVSSTECTKKEIKRNKPQVKAKQKQIKNQGHAKQQSALDATGCSKKDQVEDVQKAQAAEKLSSDTLPKSNTENVNSPSDIFPAIIKEPLRLEIAKVRITNMSMLANYKLRVGAAKVGFVAVKLMDQFAAYLEVKSNKLSNTQAPELVCSKSLESN